ncbi:M23 family metallopeptidase [Siccirubricoccus sp. KC 17139]|uniref:M23 family metallopeptidase n=1 Tax=Siccirubricoccus soli TaxID=2899147 RepID=A0ABT1DC83_9PROT|nr:M23 family metallopeptidase [Siccirubricoccus soli]MCO6419192.1 M23 family metallopeptidase [Siccirubricoccus soli]MCP2685327.1 M23 family metallopeptidase [Siccirubricoccus soli]
MPHRRRRHWRRAFFACLVLGAAPAFAQAPGGTPQLATRTLQAEGEDSAAHLLASAGIPLDQAAPALAALSPYLPRQSLRPGQALTLRQDLAAGRLIGLAIEPEPGRIVTATRAGAGWRTEEVVEPAYRHLALAAGAIRGVVVEDLRAAGLPAPLARELVQSLAQAVDLQREIGPRDRFTILFERFRNAEGRALRDGAAVYAEFHLSGHRLTLWRQQTPNGPEWFDAAGRSLRRAFLRTPLESAQVSSGFGPRRHPVLGFTRQHQGVDFAAPRGTAVFAAADGVVAEAGWRGGYGRMLRLTHADGTETLYGHLSAIEAAMKPGTPVRQGEVIGRVGATGLATGPHLHFEVIAQGHAVDPARLEAMPALRLEGPQLAAFRRQQAVLAAHLSQLSPWQEVALAP